MENPKTYCATVGFAIESANTVGYTTKTLTKQVFRLAGLSFEGVGTNGYNLNDICPYSTSVTYSDPDAQTGVCSWWSTAPQIQIQKSDGTYSTYYFLADAWYAEDSYKPGWCDKLGTLATPALFASGAAELDGESVPGQAVWFKDPGAAADVNLLSSGQVIADDVTISCPSEFRLRASALPIALELNSDDVVYSNMSEVYYSDPDAQTGVCSWWSTAPQIQVQKADGTYDTYYYLQDAWYAEDSYKPGWCDKLGTLVTPALYASGAAELDGVVPAGGGFWAKGVSQSFTITFKAK